MKTVISLLVLCCTTVLATIPACTKQDGGWSEWLRYGPCSVSCGTGTQTRHRYCDNPIPKYGGANCVGDSKEVRSCTMEDCPPSGVYDVKRGTCSKPCGGGQRTVSYDCKAPQSYGSAKCYTNCPYKDDTTEACNTDECDFPIRDVCKGCRADADSFTNTHGANFVGFACRVDRKHCETLSYGIQHMYPANDWFFLHCSPDGPWCKPCATRNLVYNAYCGSCEATRDGPCTHSLKREAKKLSKKSKDILSDDELW